jgi:hypothetical protein
MEFFPSHDFGAARSGQGRAVRRGEAYLDGEDSSELLSIRKERSSPQAVSARSQVIAETVKNSCGLSTPHAS